MLIEIYFALGKIGNLCIGPMKYFTLVVNLHLLIQTYFFADGLIPS